MEGYAACGSAEEAVRKQRVESPTEGSNGRAADRLRADYPNLNQAADRLRADIGFVTAVWS